MFYLKPLPFGYQELEPYIDTHTMGLHYHKHQKNYLNKLNSILKDNNFNFEYPKEDLYYHLNNFNKKDQYDIIFNLGGVVNHDLYWKSINPNNKEEPTKNLSNAIVKEFGTFSNFREKFINSALNLKGVGYTFLCTDSNGNIEIINTINQDSPLLFGYIPLLNVDMWEHAYYLNYENNKREYLDNYFDIVNFNYANKIFNSLNKKE